MSAPVMKNNPSPGHLVAVGIPMSGSVRYCQVQQMVSEVVSFDSVAWELGDDNPTWDAVCAILRSESNWLWVNFLGQRVSIESLMCYPFSPEVPNHVTIFFQHLRVLSDYSCIIF